MQKLSPLPVEKSNTIDEITDMSKKQKIVISASRRTDIPAFYMNWFMKQIKTGRFEAVNPFNRKIYHIPASPEKVSTIVFWSKNYDIFIESQYWKTLKKMGYNIFFNFTINSPDTILEPNLPDLEKRLEQVRFLSNEFGSDSINWRFDPLIHYQKNNIINNPLARFKEIAESISGFGVNRCITSFVDMYGKVKKRCNNISDFEYIPLTETEQVDLLLKMEGELKQHEITLNICCEKKLFELLPNHSTISQSACIDNDLLKDLSGDNISLANDTGQRKKMGCKCKKSYDIGSYSLQPCYHDCIYCYANPEKSKNRSNNIEN